MRMNSIINLWKLGGILCVFVLFLLPKAHAEEGIDSGILEELLFFRTRSLSVELVDSAETRYRSLAIQTELSAEACAQLGLCKALIAISGFEPQPSVLFPSILYDERSDCGITDPMVHLALGNANYNLNRFEIAAEHYRQILNLEKDRAPLIATVEFNLIAVYNALKEVDKAIATAKRLLTRIESSEGKEWNNALMWNHVSINLAGLYNTNNSHDRALQVLSNLDPSILDAYWQNIFHLNKFLAFNAMFQKDSCEKIWFDYLRQIPMSEIPEDLLEAVMAQSLMVDDYVQFSRSREQSRDFIHTVFLKSSSHYAELFEAELLESDLRARWDDFVKMERAYSRMARARFEALVSKKGDSLEMGNLELKIAEIRVEKEQWRSITIAIALAINVLIVVAIVHFNRKRSQKRAQLVEVFKGVPLSQTPKAITLKTNDIRVLGDAIAFGKRTADAMLILKKLNQYTQDRIPISEGDQVQNLPQYRSLKSSERQILDYLILGFESKEIARLIGCSISHVYNVRSRIRQTFEIPEDQGLEDWFKARLSEMPSDEGANE